MKSITVWSTLYVAAAGISFWGIAAPLLGKPGTNVATITRAYGAVKILSNPSKEVSGPPPRALFEGMYYSEKKAATGDRLEQGNIIQTEKSARVRLIYENGDQISIAPDSAYQVRWDINKPDAKPVVDVLMGKFRANVQKDGPRSGMQVKTRSMVMGVRGTDFYVTARGSSGESTISVLRGAVEVKPTLGNAKPVAVASGETAKIAAPPIVKKDLGAAPGQEARQEPAKPAAVTVIKTSKQELIEIQKASVVKIDSAAQAELPAAESTRLALLEKTAVTNALADIKATEPEKYAELSKQDLNKIDTDTIQAETVKTLYKTAPVDENGKPPAHELNKAGDDVYDKYFKIDQ